MIFILFGEGKKVERVYRLSKESIVYQRENVERRSGGEFHLGDGNSFHQH